jgi:ABC-type sugar transport system ATPase subunit
MVNPVQLRTPQEARLAGTGIIYQELTVAPNLTVSGNVFLGSELKRFGFLKDTARMDRKTQEVLDRLGARFKATQRASHLRNLAVSRHHASAIEVRRFGQQLFYSALAGANA